MAEFSIVGSGNLLCSGKCTYCSATSVQDVDYKGKGIKKEDFGQIIWDWDGVKKIYDTNPIIQNAIKSGEKIILNWWAAEPLDFYKDAEKYWDWVHENYPTLKFSAFISTNSIPLAKKWVVEWVYKMHDKYGLELQISHDGLGQFCRTRTFDPFYSPSTKDTIVKLVKNGIVTMINATLNNFNYSMVGNLMYFNKWRFENHLEDCNLMIKLNHNNDSEYTGDYRLTGEHLNRYFHEYELIAQQCYLLKSRGKDDVIYRPYIDYFYNQMMRFDTFRSWGGCAQYSLGIKDTTWCCNTKGEYVFCQLCNDPKDNPNPDLKRSKECETCEFYHYDDCHPCPDMVQSDHCIYKKEYIRFCLRMKQFIAIVDNLNQGEWNAIKEVNRLRNGGNNQCTCNNPQQR